MRLNVTVLYGMVALACGLSSVAIALALYQPKFVTVDIKGTVQYFSRQLADHGLSDEAQRAQITRFSQALAEITQRYAKHQNVVVLVAPAVVAGAPDITQHLQTQLLEQLREVHVSRRQD